MAFWTPSPPTAAVTAAVVLSPLEVELRRRNFSKTYETFLKAPDVRGAALTAWCRHVYIMNEIGLGDWTEQDRIVKARVADDEVKYLVFLDLDETLTANNERPPKFPLLSEERLLDDYIEGRVPLEMRPRIGALLQMIRKRPDIAWFILTDNIYMVAKCTLKLAYDIDVPTGSIIDYGYRQKYHANNASKAQFITYCIEQRQREQVAPAKILFVDNAPVHRVQVANALQKYDNINAMVCCNNLVTGLDQQHIRQIVEFLSPPASVSSSTTSANAAKRLRVGDRPREDKAPAEI